MSLNLKTRLVYFNVDRGYWSDELGNVLLPTQIPRFSLYEKSVLKLNLIHDGGTEVEDYAETQIFSFVCFDYEGSPVIASDNTKINSDEAKEYWVEETGEDNVITVKGANTAKGRFAIILDCATTELKSALTGYVSCFFNSEFTISEGTTIIAVQSEKCYFNNVSGDSGVVDGIVFGNPVTNYEKDIPVGSDYVILDESTDTYSLSGAIIVAPEEGSEVYFITNVSKVEGSLFKVFINATVQEEGHKLSYTLIKKG